MGQFADKVKEFELDVSGLPPVVIKKIAFEIYIRTVKRTRYRTGRARGSWLISVGRASSAVPGRLSTGPSGSEFGKMTGYEGDMSIFIVSNLNYIRHLEFGSQKFPGDHMLARTVAEFKPIVDRMVREVRGG
jgi:hypothetical protein